MADQSWVANTAAKTRKTTLDGTEDIRIGDVGVSKRATPADLAAYAGGVVAPNNIPVRRQRNAVDTANIDLPYIDNFNRTFVSGPMLINAASADAEYNSVIPINVSALAHNKSIYYAQSNVVTGTVYAMNFANLAATTGVYATIGNNSVNGHTVLELSNRPGTGDTFVALSAADDSMGWCLGVDQSATAFKICAGVRRLGGSAGTEDRVVIDNNVAEFKRPVKLPAYTVATLPTPSATYAGAVAYVTDASLAAPVFMTAPIGGGANRVPVNCSGTAWNYG